MIEVTNTTPTQKAIVPKDEVSSLKPEHDNKPSEDKVIKGATIAALGATALAAVTIAGIALKGHFNKNNLLLLNNLKEEGHTLKHYDYSDWRDIFVKMLKNAGRNVDSNELGSVLTVKDYDVLIKDFTKKGGSYFDRQVKAKQELSALEAGLSKRLSELNDDPAWDYLLKRHKELSSSKREELLSSEIGEYNMIMEMLRKKFSKLEDYTIEDIENSNPWLWNTESPENFTTYLRLEDYAPSLVTEINSKKYFLNDCKSIVEKLRKNKEAAQILTKKIFYGG